jgi:hypothetical protein
MPEKPDNIIAFPKKKILNGSDFSGPVQTEDDVRERVEAVKHIHVDLILEAIIETIVQQLIVGGFDTDEGDSKSIAFVAEGMRSLMLAQYNIYHPFQDIMEHSLVENEEGIFIVADEIHMIVGNEEDEIVEDELSTEIIITTEAG